MATSQDLSYKPISRLVSPIVATREIDQSFLAQGVANIGGAIVGPFAQGPGFTPVTVTSIADFEALFGVPDGTYYTPYTVEQYLAQSNIVTIVRTGQLGGYIQQNPILLLAQSGSTSRQAGLGIFTSSIGYCTITTAGVTGSVTGSVTSTFLNGPLSGSLFSIPITASFVSGSVGYISGSSKFSSGSILYTLPASTGNFAGSVFTAFVSSSTVGSSIKYNIQGNISGSYGAFIPNTFVANGSTPLLLATLANSAYDSAQNLNGFTGSILTAVNTGSIGSDYFLSLADLNPITLTTSSYGTYRFSLDSTSPSWLTNVFSTDPTAGAVAVAAGQKIDAAYIYNYFENTIDQVLGSMLTNGNYQVKIANADGVYFDPVSSQYLPNQSLKFSDGVPGGGGGVNNVAWSAYDLREAETPWINSQKISSWSGSVSQSSTRYNLFKVHTLSDGTSTNTNYKIQIQNVKLAGQVPGSDYGLFDLVVRSFTDTDRRPYVLERYSNLSLDPSSVNYIARRIGDSYSSIDYNGKILQFGTYNNQSKYVRVEMTVSPIPVTAVPYGFDSYASPIGGQYAHSIPLMTYTSASIYSKQPGKYSSGIVFQPAPAGADAELSALYPDGTSQGAELDNLQYFAPIPENSVTGNNYFDLNDFCGIPAVYSPSNESTNILMRNFTLGFQQGFDGGSPSIPKLLGNDILPSNTQGLDCTSIVSSGSVAYKNCLDALSNADEFDINLLATPGILYNLHPHVVNLGVNICENRGDAFYIFDIYANQTAGGNSIDNVVSTAAEFDTNYAATYYPWIKIVDTNTNQIITVPPSVVMPSIYAQNDKVANEWNAPAGLNRGGITQAVGVVDRLTQTDRDTLYDGRVNPIASFPGTGIVAWGQKTLQVLPSALDRVNVRRLLIALKKFIASSSKYLLFEQNVATTRNKFLSIVNPYLESVVQRNGLYAFRVQMDANNNTAALIDQNILYGNIFLQPTKSIEIILLDFRVLPSGAVFPND